MKITYRHSTFIYHCLLLTFFSIFLPNCNANTNTKKWAEAKTNIPSETTTDSVDKQIVESYNWVPGQTFPYQLDVPDVEFKLPNKLREVSGLGIDAGGHHLYAVQDEEGDLFLINTKTGLVDRDFKFHKDGDYEGIEFVKGRVFVVKSSGTLYEVLSPGTNNQELIKHKFSFSKNSDVEGLGYDPISNCLLLSCKGKAGQGAEFELKKGIFSFSLDSMKLRTEPSYIISLEAVKDFLQLNDSSLEKIDKLIKLFKPGEEFIFGPSGIAVHPKTKDIYIISSVGKVLVVLTQSGDIKHMVKLKKKVHPQPEGICFDQNGTLYIANEGREGKGKIYKFLWKM